MTTLVRRLAAEGLGTSLLVATVIGSGIMATRLTGDLGLALLANALATGAILVVLIAVLGPLSGAHFNPAVSVVAGLRRELPVGDVVFYALVQIAGAVLGAVVAHAMFDLPLVRLSAHSRAGLGQWLGEGIATFGLVLVIVGGRRVRPGDVPWLVGLYIIAAYWFTSSTSFANPAVTIGRMVTDTFSGIRPVDAPAFIAAQLIGAVVAAALAGWLWNRGHAAKSG